MKSCKRASLNLSINAIVIIVLAMTMLGLGLGFIRGQFKQITKTTLTVQQQVEAQIMEDLRVGNKKLSFPSPSVNLDRGSTATFALGVKNILGVGELVLQVNLSAVEGTQFGTEYADKITFFFDTEPFPLAAADSKVIPFQITDRANVVDTYKVRITVWDTTNDKLYDSKIFFLTIA